jgi:hypothetical protein
VIVKFIRWLFPPSRWSRCHEPMPWERLANYERRLGEFKAMQRMQDAERQQRFDAKAIVRPSIKPKLPTDNVVSIKRKRRA